MLEHHSHTSVSLLAPAISWLVFLATALFHPPMAGLLAPLSAMAFGAFLALPFPMFKHLILKIMDVTAPWRGFRYLRITRSSPNSFRRPQDWRFIGIARKSE